MHKNSLIKASILGAWLVFSATSAALGQTPTVKQLYQMLLNQQKQIQTLQRRAANAERELRNARRQLRQNQGNTAVTKKSVVDAQNAAAAARAAARQANAAIVKSGATARGSPLNAASSSPMRNRMEPTRLLRSWR